MEAKQKLHSMISERSEDTKVDQALMWNDPLIEKEWIQHIVDLWDYGILAYNDTMPTKGLSKSMQQ